MVFHKKHNAHVLCETEKFTNIWVRCPQRDFIIPPNIRLQRHPHCPNSCKIFCLSSSVPTYGDCTVCQTKFMMLYAGHFITDNTSNNLITCLSQFVMYLLRDIGLDIFLTQILIWSHSVAVLPSFTWHGSWIRNFTHTFLSYILTIFYSSSALQPAWQFCAGSCPTYVRPILAVSWQPHCLLPHNQAARLSKSLVNESTPGCLLPEPSFNYQSSQ
jgi:hypothetical protein